MSKSIYVLACCLLFSIPLTAQSTWSAEGSGISVWVGASISSFNPDYGCTDSSPWTCLDHQLLGISPYVQTSALMFHRVGAEGQARFLHWRGPSSLTESSYMAGPRVALYRKRNFIFSGKFMIGSARISLPSPAPGSGTYLAYAPGGSVDYRLSKRLFARVDYEYQIWPNFKGSATGGGHGGLTPNGLSLGLSYAILH